MYVAGVVNAHIQLGDLLVELRKVIVHGVNRLNHRLGSRVVDRVVHLMPNSIDRNASGAKLAQDL